MSKKGAHILLESYKNLKKKYPEIKLMLVGPASGVFHELKVSFYSAKILDTLKKLDGLYLSQISENELIGVYNACDLFVLPTLELEMFEMVLAAMNLLSSVRGSGIRMPATSPTMS